MMTPTTPIPTTPTPLYAQIAAAASSLQDLLGGVAPRVGIVLGSGAGGVATRLEAASKRHYAEIPHFPPSHVAGHAGELWVGALGSVPCLVMSGRAHGYEGHSAQASTFGIRVMARLGIQDLLLTNAAGGINPGFSPGDLMVITDHLNMTGDNPLRGPNDERLGTRFPDMSQVYSAALRLAWHRAARVAGFHLREGIYAAMAGPSYETPAEIRMLGRLGADAVGMSTVHEAIVAQHMGVRVAALSVISNLAAGLSPVPLSHADVTETAQRVQTQLADLVVGMVREVQA